MTNEELADRVDALADAVEDRFGGIRADMSTGGSLSVKEVCNMLAQRLREESSAVARVRTEHQFIIALDRANGTAKTVQYEACPRDTLTGIEWTISGQLAKAIATLSSDAKDKRTAEPTSLREARKIVNAVWAKYQEEQVWGVASRIATDDMANLILDALERAEAAESQLRLTGTEDAGEFRVGDAVEKVTGDYKFPGTVISVMRKLSGLYRYAVEDDRGAIHIFNASQLARRT